MRRLFACCLALALAGPAFARTGDGTNYTTTPMMSLYEPTPGVCGALGVEPRGKSWLELLNASLTLVDQHNHSPGFGLPIPANGLNIDGDVPWNGFNLYQLRAARFSPIALGSVTALDVGTVFVSGADLYYVDTSGNVVRLTASGAIAGTPGSISGLTSPAAVTYTPASKLFAFTSSSGYAANMSQGPTSVCDASVSGGQCATVQAPAALASSYGLTLPTALPASTLPMTLSSSGQVATAQLVASQIANGVITSAQISPSAGITGSQMANQTVTATQIANAAVGPTQTTAVSAPTASQLVVRDASGRAQFATPSAAADAETLGHAQGTDVTGSITAATGWSSGLRARSMGNGLNYVEGTIAYSGAGAVYTNIANGLPGAVTGAGVAVPCFYWVNSSSTWIMFAGLISSTGRLSQWTGTGPTLPVQAAGDYILVSPVTYY